MTTGEVLAGMFNICTGFLIIIVGLVPRLLMNICGYKTNICTWLDRYFPLPE